MCVTWLLSPLGTHESRLSLSAVDLASALCSDSEEFADDEVLVDLRNRRAAYLRRLADVTTALERST